MPSGSRWGPWRSILALSPILLGAPWLAYDHHYKLPEPLSALTNPVTKLPQISEERILGMAKHLSEGIGYRIVGSYEHALADDWMVEAAEMVQRNCERVVLLTGRKLECEVWRQEGSGNHRFDMMGKRLYKTYVNISNIIVRISDGTVQGKEHALLLNAHLDSTIPSPGAADDALSVGVMLDCMRVLVETPDWSPRHAVIFLFNNAEESLQDGSHLYATQHPTASTVRAVINLEAAGSSGRELLFQATSQEMIDVYSRVPRPYGSVFANEIFSSGIILSDTDFRQFELYLNVTGLDMAVVGNSYLYHMQKDLVENIEPGVAQHMAENVLSLIRDLSSSNSPLPSLTAGYTKPSTVFFSHLYQSFLMYSYTTAKIMHTTLLVLSVIFVRVTHAHSASGRFWNEHLKGCFAVLGGLFGALLASNVVALIMTKMDKALSWFTNPLAPVALYGPAGLLGALISQYLIGQTNERSIYHALLLIQSFIALVVQLFGIGSAALFFVSALPIFIAILLDPIFASQSSVNRRLSLCTYALAQIPLLLSASQVLLGIVDVFVPLTGRMGSETPADNMIATIVTSSVALAFPLVLPFSHRFGRKALLRGVFNVFVMVGLLMALFALRVPFDKMHQKRLFVIHQENIATGEHHLHVATADSAPGFDPLVKDIAEEFGNLDGGHIHSLKPVVLDDHNPDWDHLYPFSAFLRSYKIPLSTDPHYSSPWIKEQAFRVTAFDHMKRIPGTRNVSITVDHPGLIWTVVAFDAHVLQWSLDDKPPDEYARHHIKEASFYGQDTYSFNMVIKDEPASSPQGGGKIRIDFVGMQEKGIWAAKRALGANGGIAMGLFEKLDKWLDQRTHGTVDALLMGCVIGMVDV